MRYLGAAIGSSSLKDSYVKEKIAEWIVSVERLAKIAVTEPQGLHPTTTKQMGV